MTNGYNAFEKEETVHGKRSEKRGTMFSLLAGLIVLLVIISVLAYRSGINIKEVRADIAGFATALKERYGADGENVTFTYGAVDGSGGLFHKTVTIANPSLNVESNGQTYNLTTSGIRLTPSDNDFHEFKATLAAPLNFSRPQDEEVIRYKTPAPLTFDVTTNEAGMQEYLLPLQKTSSFNVERGGMVSTYDVTLAETSFVAGAFSPRKSKDHALSLSLDDATIMHQGTKTAFSHAAYDFTASAEDGEQTELSIEALSSDLIPATLAPIALDVSEKRTKDPVTHDLTFTIEKLVLTGNGFDLDVGGNVALKTAELLPLVDIKVSTNGIMVVLKALQEKGYVSPEIGQIIVGSFKRIAPEWNEQSSTPLQFAVRRTATEPFMVGKMKADELLAIALKEWYVRSGGTDAPAAVEHPAEPGISGITPPAGAVDGAPAADDKQPAAVKGSESQPAPAPAALPQEGKPLPHTAAPAVTAPADPHPHGEKPVSSEPVPSAPALADKAAPALGKDDTEDAD